MRLIPELPLALCLMAMPAQAQQLLMKTGSCPNGYFSSGNYCVPSKNAGAAIQKTGPCPSGYFSSGAYCLGSPNAKPAIIEVGSCPDDVRWHALETFLQNQL